jgi:hypothetical protein
METISDITNLHAEGVRKTTETIEQLATLSERLTEAIGNFKIRESETKAEMPARKAIPSQRPQPPQPQPQPQMMQVMEPQPQEMTQFTAPAAADEEEELITEEDFFKTS